MRKQIRSLNSGQMLALMSEIGEKPFRGKQLFEWVHGKQVASFEEMSNLPKGLRERLDREFIVDPLSVLKMQQAKDGETAKFLFELPDGECIESVWMHYKHGDSVCVSSQVGCRMGCSFCASTIDGLVRNLTPGEMLSQIYDIEREMYRGDLSEDVSGAAPAGQGEGKRIGSIIVMGMGEPFDNYDNLMAFIRLLTDKDGRNLSARSITVSTCGIAEGIYRLAEEGLPVTLALSLHAPNDEIRRRLMPVAKAYPMDEVLEACRAYFSKTGRRVTFEYSMIRGVNDRPEHAEELAQRCRSLQRDGMPVHINLIPLNAVEEREHKRAADSDIRLFQKTLEKHRINSTIRREMGSEIDAACGQLRKKHAK